MPETTDIPNVLDYRRPPAAGERPQSWWWWRFTFPLAMVSSLIAMAGSAFASRILYGEFQYTGPRAVESAVFTLFLIGIPLMFLLMVTSAITIGLVLSESHEPWHRSKLAMVVLPQIFAVLTPFLVVLIFGRAV